MTEIKSFSLLLAKITWISVKVKKKRLEMEWSFLHRAVALSMADTIHTQRDFSPFEHTKCTRPSSNSGLYTNDGASEHDISSK